MINDFINTLRKVHGMTYEYRQKVKKEIPIFSRKYRNHYERRKIKRKDFTIISNSCIGGVICHDLNIQFQSPTVNIYIRPKDFVKFCSNIHYYMEMPFTETPYDEKVGYPVAKVGDIPLYCKHYSDFQEAKQAWDKRKKRINWEHIYLMMTDRDFLPPVSITKSINACDEDVIKRFDELPFENKVCIVKNKEYAEKYKSCRQLMKGCDSNCAGIITNVIGLTGKRMYQYVNDFDYIEFINSGR